MLALLGYLAVFAQCLPMVVVGTLLSRDSSPRVVFAHHMVGNTYPYTQQDWAADINLAHTHGIDAFALNVGRDPWQPSRVQDAYAAALQSGTGFKLFLSFDMTSLPCSTPNDAANLRNYVTTFASHPNQFRYNGKVFVSTFSGENCYFSQGSPVQGWSSQFLSKLTGPNSAFFVPSIFIDPSTFASSGWLNIMDGGFNWNSAWPSTENSNANSLDADRQYSSDLQGKAYVAGVSPWFFTHYSSKNRVFLTDDLYPSRWNALVQSRDSIPMIEIITWNDYGESHYIGPIEGAQPDSQAWVNGFDHQAWLHMTNYFATAYKTGTYPKIMQDTVYVWARPHPKDANAPDPLGKPANYDAPADALFAVVLATGSATLQLNSRSFSVSAGFSQYSVPLSAGDKMHATLMRGGSAIVDINPSDYVFNPNPSSYNYNAYVAMAHAGSC